VIQQAAYVVFLKGSYPRVIPLQDAENIYILCLLTAHRTYLCCIVIPNANLQFSIIARAFT